MDTFNEAWDVICDYLKKKRENGKKAISDVAYNAWINKIQPIGIDFDTSRIVLSVPTKLNKNVITNSYMGILKVASEEVFGQEFDFVIENNVKNICLYVKHTLHLRCIRILIRFV